MHKNITKHEKFITAEIDKIKANHQDQDISEKVSRKQIKDLIDFHQKTIANFQHERLIHLIVTFFFGALLIKSVIALFLLTFLSTNPSNSLLNNLIMTVSGILFVVELFYIRHYYRLENGTQKLYILSEKLFHLLKAKN